MVKTIRVSIGKSNEESSTKSQKLHQFDQLISNEIESGMKLIKVDSMISGENEEIMIVVLGDKYETRRYTDALLFLIFLMLFFIALHITAT